MKRRISLILWIVVALVAVKLTLNLHPWNRKAIVDHDVVFYYGYLPATFIYHDWSFKFADNPSFSGKVWSLPLADGNRVQKMTMGLAFLYAPFFFMAHAYTLLTGGVADGYSVTYQGALVWAGLFYYILGLFLVRKILSRWFEDWVVACVIVILGLGTNLFNYATWDGAMSHGYSFCLFAGTLLVFQKWITGTNWWLTILLGLCAGLIVLIRPTNILFVIFLALLFWFQEIPFSEKLRFLRALRWKWVLLVGSGLLVWLPQLAYWKMNTGHWFFYSYIGEPFFFSRPQILNGLFSYRKGWLVYTPVMIFSLVGICLLRNRVKTFFWPVLITIGLAIYVIYSWWCWWYGGSFGSRAMIEFYVVLSIPLAAFIHTVFQKKRNWLLKSLTSVILVFLVWLNLFQTTQYRGQVIHFDSMSKKAYWSVFLKNKKPENYQELLIPADAGETLQRSTKN
jgi:hypothetical protein